MSRVVTVVLIVAVACVCAAPEHNKIRRAAYFGFAPPVGKVPFWMPEEIPVPDNLNKNLGASSNTMGMVEGHSFNNNVDASNYGVLGINEGNVSNTHNDYAKQG